MSMSLAEGAGQSIQLPDNDDVALAGTVEELHQFQPFGLGPRCLFLVDAGTFGSFECIHLQMGLLRICRDAGIADFHGAETKSMRLLCTLSSAP